MTDFQTSLITTPYMVYSPRLKGRAHALYTGSTLIHQLAFCLITMFGVAWRRGCVVTIGVGPRGLGPVLQALVLVIALIMLREHARRVSFARLRLMTAFPFLIPLSPLVKSRAAPSWRFQLLSTSRAYWVIGLVSRDCRYGVALVGPRLYDPRISESLADLKKNWLFGKWVSLAG